MTTLTAGLNPLEWLLTDEGAISVDQVTVTVAGAVALPSGTVLGKITATGKYVKYNSGAADGSQTAVAVLRNSLPGTNGDYKQTVYSRLCEVWGAKLNDGTGVNATVTGQLAAVNIIVR